jgi:hypothetical protein
MTGKQKINAKPDAHLEALVVQVQTVTENWAKRHDFWHDSGHKDPLKHYDTEPGQGAPILTFWSEGTAGRCLNEGYDEGEELYSELEELGVFLELDDRVTANYYLIDHESELQHEFDRWAQWKWTCRLIEADTADVSGDIYTYFAEHPQDFRRLPHRAFEELVSSVCTARGWKTKIGPGTGDKGVDVRMWLESPLGDSLTLVQAKRYDAHRPIQLEAVAALEAHCKREEASGLFITTSRYLPGVHEWASRNKDLILADSRDMQAWCREASQEAIRARAHATALESFWPMVHEIREGRANHRLVVCTKYSPNFCVVLKENSTGALLAHIPSKVVTGNFQRGESMPVLDGTMQDGVPDGPVFRAIRKQGRAEPYYWGRQNLYSPWNGQPVGFDTWD